jgi:hypothetical protein
MPHAKTKRKIAAHYSKPSRAARQEKRAKAREAILANIEAAPKAIEELEAKVKELKDRLMTTPPDKQKDVEGKISSIRAEVAVWNQKEQAAQLLQLRLAGYVSAHS